MGRLTSVWSITVGVVRTWFYKIRQLPAESFWAVVLFGCAAGFTAIYQGISLMESTDTKVRIIANLLGVVGFVLLLATAGSVLKWWTSSPLQFLGDSSVIVENDGSRVLYVRLKNGSIMTPVDKIQVQLYDVVPKLSNLKAADLEKERFFLGPAEFKDIAVLSIPPSGPYQILGFPPQTIPRTNVLTIALIVFSTSTKIEQRFRVSSIAGLTLTQ